MSKLRILVIALSVFLLAGYAQAGSWYSPLTAVAVGPDGPATLISVTPDSTTEAIIVEPITPVGAENEQWVKIGLTVPPQKVIKAVDICYQVNGSASIDTVRLTRMTTPVTPVALREPTTLLNSTDAICERLDMSPIKAKGAITLSLRVVFVEMTDSIKIGGIRLVF